MKKIINIFFIIILIIIFDLIFTLFIFSKFNYYEIFYPNKDHRISNEIFHHSFKKNVKTFDYWGSKKYEFTTNSLGFKDNTSRKIIKKTDYKKRIVINGDSFTEGIGFKYSDTFVGLLDRHFKNKIEILNAGVASQSPILYLKKINYLIEEEKLIFDELILFLDISDIPDDYYYNQNYKVNKIKSLRDRVQIFLLKNSTSYLFIDVFFTKLDFVKRDLLHRFDAAKYLDKNIFKNTTDEVSLYKSISVKRGMWTHENFFWKLHGKKGRNLATENMNNLVKIITQNDIKLTLVIYPWPSQIYNDMKASLHRDYWREWSKKNDINFIDLFVYFENKKSEDIIKKYFIKGDVHWNKEGHKYIYEKLLEEYFY